MNVEVRSHGVRLSDAERAFAEARFEAELAHAAEWVRSVRVFVADENGPKHGVDKSCRVVVALARGQQVVVVEHGAAITAALDLAADRAGEAVLRQVGRARGPRRSGLVRAVSAVMGAFGRK
jgi:putative sigma-54 modulation protein